MCVFLLLLLLFVCLFLCLFVCCCFVVVVVFLCVFFEVFFGGVSLNDTCMYAYAFVDCREARAFVRQEMCSQARAGVRV